MLFDEFLKRRARQRALRQCRDAIAMISDRDLADMGIKRHQLDPSAALKISH
jgi:uncharacterized protein YjiS (DUF1127 family)